MKYKVGDRVRIKSFDWYNNNKDEDGDVPCNCNVLFLVKNKKYLGTIQTVETVYICKGQYVGNCIYKLKGIENTDWTDEMIEGLVEEEKVNHAWIPQVVKLDEIHKNERFEITLNDGYEFKDENGNVINVTKIVLEKKKKEYPKTYEECYQITGLLKTSDIYGYKNGLLFEFQKLLIARDAYWKIAGEEMGLGKPWEPDWDDDEWPDMYYISWDGKHLEKEKGYPCCNMILIFPTVEMRDAFYENFKELIESCKELL